MDTATGIGASGRKYSYGVYLLSTIFRGPGNYVFAKKVEMGYAPIYIGQTGALEDRFDDHHKMPCIIKHGATHFLVHKGADNEEVRCAEEADMVAYHRPTCNG